MGIEKITSKIIGEAEENEKLIIAEAETKCQTILADAQARAQALIAAGEKNGQIEKEKLISRQKSVSAIDSRKLILQKKQEIIADCFAQAIDTIIAMPEGEYLQLLTALGSSAGVTAGALIFNPDEQARIGQKTVDALNAKVKGGKFTLSQETRKVQGGFLLQTGKVYINNTVEALVEEHKKVLSGEVAAALFDEQKADQKPQETKAQTPQVQP